jgi:UDP-glucose 4-epimerase
MHVLLTGGAGFIGSHLTQVLLDRGDRVTVLDDFSTGAVDNVVKYANNPHFAFTQGSILDADLLNRLVADADAIVHLAAAVGVQLVVERPTQTIETNVLGTHTVLHAALKYRCRTLIASTSEVYGKSTKLPFREEDDLVLGASSRARWSYAASKLLDEFLGLSAHRERGLPVTIVRFFNTVGPGQTGRYGMVVPRFVRQALRHQPLTVFGDGEQSRCFCHVLDVVQALLGLLDQPARTAGEIYNIGNTHEVTINQLARSVLERTDSHSVIQLIPYSEAYAPGFEDMRRRIPDTSKIQTAIGWQPQRELEQIIDDVIAFERKRL